MAERLGTGLQNLVQRFDSASHLKKPMDSMGFFRYDLSIRGSAPNVLLWGLCPQIPRGSQATDIALRAPSRLPPGGLRTAFASL